MKKLAGGHNNPNDTFAAVKPGGGNTPPRVRGPPAHRTSHITHESGGGIRYFEILFALFELGNVNFAKRRHRRSGFVVYKQASNKEAKTCEE